MSIEEDRRQAMDFYGVGSYELDNLLSDPDAMPEITLRVAGNTATNQVTRLDLDTEYEAYCKPNGD